MCIARWVIPPLGAVYFKLLVLVMIIMSKNEQSVEKCSYNILNYLSLFIFSYISYFLYFLIRLAVYIVFGEWQNNSIIGSLIL